MTTAASTTGPGDDGRDGGGASDEPRSVADLRVASAHLAALDAAEGAGGAEGIDATRGIGTVHETATSTPDARPDIDGRRHIDDGLRTDPPEASFDPAEHAARFEAVHDALVAVLADVDQASDQPPGRSAGQAPEPEDRT